MSITEDLGNPDLVQAKIMKNRIYLCRDLKIVCTYYFPRNDRIFLERSMDAQGHVMTIIRSGTQRRPAAYTGCISVEKRAVDKIRRADPDIIPYLSVTI